MAQRVKVLPQYPNAGEPVKAVDALFMGMLYNPADDGDYYGGPDLMAVIRIDGNFILSMVHPSRILWPEEE